VEIVSFVIHRKHSAFASAFASALHYLQLAAWVELTHHLLPRASFDAKLVPQNGTSDSTL